MTPNCAAAASLCGRRLAKGTGTAGGGPAGSRPLPCPRKGSSATNLSPGTGFFLLPRASAGNFQLLMRQGVTATVPRCGAKLPATGANNSPVRKPLWRKGLRRKPRQEYQSEVDICLQVGIIAEEALSLTLPSPGGRGEAGGEKFEAEGKRQKDYGHEDEQRNDPNLVHRAPRRRIPGSILGASWVDPGCVLGRFWPEKPSKTGQFIEN